jgi:isochorismate hydrolase
MKVTYFTPETVHSKAEAMLAQIGQNRRTNSINSRYIALLVLDMQDFFLEPVSHAYIPSAPAIIPNLSKLIAAFSQHHLPVIFTRHINTTENAASMSRWWRDLITAEDPLSSITPQLDTTGQHVLIKSQYDAFYQTELEAILKEQDITQVVVTGVMTHLCCETTARSAFMRGFDVFFVVDGTATYNEAFHQASLRNLAHGFATLILTADLLRTLSENGS